MRIVVWFGALLALLALPALTPVASAETPNEVRVGVYVTRFNDLDMARRSFDITFWGWYMTTAPDYNPLDTIEITNAKKVSTKFILTQMKEDHPWNGEKATVYWHQAKYTANIIKDWDVTNYPFDRQDLIIRLEDAMNDIGSVILVPDNAGSGIDDDVVLPGWTIKSFGVSAEENKYLTNYGDQTGADSGAFSRVVAKMTIEREGCRVFINVFTGFFVSFLLVFITYCMGTNKTGFPRVGVISGAIFAAIGNKSIVDNTLPDSSGFSLADGVELASFAAIVFALAITVVVIWFEERHPRHIKAFNAGAAVLSVIGYVGAIGLLVLRAQS